MSCVSQRVLERVAKVHFYFRRTEPVILRSVICDERTQPLRIANPITRHCVYTPQPYFSACSNVLCISWCIISMNVDIPTFFVPGSTMSSVR